MSATAPMSAVFSTASETNDVRRKCSPWPVFRGTPADAYSARTAFATPVPVLGIPRQTGPASARWRRRTSRSPSASGKSSGRFPFCRDARDARHVRVDLAPVQRLQVPHRESRVRREGDRHLEPGVDLRKHARRLEELPDLLGGEGVDLPAEDAGLADLPDEVRDVEPRVAGPVDERREHDEQLLHGARRPLRGGDDEALEVGAPPRADRPAVNEPPEGAERRLVVPERPLRALPRAAAVEEGLEPLVGGGALPAGDAVVHPALVLVELGLGLLERDRAQCPAGRGAEPASMYRKT